MNTDRTTIKKFENKCTCGGHMWFFTSYKKEQPHIVDCPQYKEWARWYEEFQSIENPIEFLRNWNLRFEGIIYRKTSE